MKVGHTESRSYKHRRPALPTALRGVALLLVSILFLEMMPVTVWAEGPAGSARPAAIQDLSAVADSSAYNPPLVRTPTNIVARIMPQLQPVSLSPSFSNSPTDTEITRTRVFSERLYPMGGQTTAEENRLLASALLAYYQGPRDDNVSVLTAFLQKYPQSVWRASLLENVGTIYRRSGRFTKAFDAWEEAWKLARDKTDPGSRAVANRVLGNLAELNAAVGRTDRLQALLTEANSRQVRGSAAGKIASARRRLKMMLIAPEITFKCGARALDRILGAPLSSNTTAHLKLSRAQATAQGMSLSQLAQLSADLGMNHQMAKREPGASVMVPAVVNWKVGHYGALVKEREGRYLLHDPASAPASGRDIWVTRETLDEEASGYFLVPAGSLPRGWRTVGAQEGATVWGKCAPWYWFPPCPCCCGTGGGSGGEGGDTGPAPVCMSASCSSSSGSSSGGCCTTCGMAQYDVYLSSAALHVFDTPVGYQPPRGPAVNFIVTYNQFDVEPESARQISSENYSNLGDNWTFNWFSFIPTNASGGTVEMYPPGGGALVFTDSGTGTGTFAPQIMTGANLAFNSSGNQYVDTLSDGSQRIYGQPDGQGNLFLTQMIDPQGNTNSLVYDSTNGILRVRYLIDSLGQTNVVDYGLSDDLTKITKVTDPFNRSANFSYTNTSSDSTPSYQLTGITDVMNITSQFTYADTDNDPYGYTYSFISALTTPYGTTTFTYIRPASGSGQGLVITDPLGQQEQIMAYLGGAPDVTGEPANEVPPGFDDANIFLNNGWAVTYFWDKEAMKEAPDDPTKAKMYAFFADEDGDVSGVKYLEKNPLENPVWYAYPGEASGDYFSHFDQATNVLHPSAIARVLDDGGTTQIYSNEYNNVYGQVTKKIDPLGRATTYVYDPTNQIDLLEVRQTTGTSNDLLAKHIYNSQHLVLTNVDASGQTTTYTYNPYGQVLTSTDAKGETTSFVYSNSYLIAIIDATGTTNMTYTYDLFGRVRTVMDSEGYMITTDYDAMDRPTVITYPDGTYRQIVYQRLDEAATRDRLGRWTRKLYDPLRRVVAVEDPLRRITQFEYCTCGGLETLIDPLWHTTSWSHDLEGRVNQKTYADGTSIQYTYENTTSRLKLTTDAKGQNTVYAYNVDNTLQQISYSNAVVSTPSVSYTYDTNYNRLVTMVDGTGTTTYNYSPITTPPTTLGAGKLASIVGPLPNSTIMYSYDQLGRVLSRAINGVANAVTYDNLGRVTTVSNALGAFTNTYVGVTARLSTMGYPNGQITTNTYYGNTGDERLQEIWNQGSGASTISKFDYTYDSEGEIQSWTQQMGTTNNAYGFQYDAASQLVEALQSGAAVSTNEYTYDAAGNRLSERINDALTGASYNNVNELTSQSGGGLLRFRGSINETSTVSVAGVSASVTWTNIAGTNTLFDASASVNVGTNVVPVIAQDYNGNAQTNNYQVVVTGGVTNTLTYDLNGNLSAISNSQSAITYVWDAANRLVALESSAGVSPVSRSEFAYDGLSRRARQTEISGTTTNSDHWMLWCGTQLCEERDSTGGTVSNRFFAQGEQIGGTSYFFNRDHLGSIREMTDGTGAIRARYSYDPWGRRTKVSGDLEADFGFTGHYFHAPSGLHLALYRAYSADLGRWLSRDLLYEGGRTSLLVEPRADTVSFHYYHDLLVEGLQSKDSSAIVDRLNLYQYVANAPLTRIDVLGLCCSKSECRKKCDRFKRDCIIACGIACIIDPITCVCFPACAVTVVICELDCERCTDS